MTNLRVVLRGLLRTPLFTTVAILSLALGIGANTAIFSLLDQIVLRTLPVRNSSELVDLYHPGPLQGALSTDEDGGPSFSYPMFRELQKLQTPFSGLAGARNDAVSLAYHHSATHGTARLVSGNYFAVLGVQPRIGRLLTEGDDDQPGAHPVAVLSYGAWVSQFGGDAAVLNQPLIVNGFPMTIVGVAPKGFTSEKIGDPPDVYLPITMKKAITPDWNAFNDRRNYWVTLFARVKPGITPQQASTAINVAYRAQLQQDIALLRQPRADFLKRFQAKKIVLKPGDHGRGGIRDAGKQPLYLLMGMTLLVLLIACANVANLQLARGAARMRETAVRLAMGAARRQLIGQLLTESSLLAIAGGALGLLAAHLTLRGILAMIPPAAGMQGFLSDSLDTRVLLFSLALSVVTGIVFGLFPALQSSKADLVTALKNQAGQTSLGGTANLFRKTLVTAQIGVSLLLLISAGLFGRTLVNLTRINLGIRTDHLLTFSLLPRLNQYSDQGTAAFHKQLAERLAAIPGVTMVSAAQEPAIAGSWSGSSVVVEGFVPQTDDGANSSFDVVDDGYFRTMGMPLISGREFTRADDAKAPKVAVVNEAFVRHFLPNQNPLGRHLGRGGPGSRLDTEIVGLVKDAKYADAREPVPPVFYTPLEQSTHWFTLFYYLRTALAPEALAPQVRRAVASLDPNLPIREMKTMEGQIEENMFEERILSTLTACFAGLASLLASVGLYGVLAYSVARRTREIGIRMALGAASSHVRSLVAREVAVMLAIGTIAGAGAAAATGKFMASMLFNMKPWDALVYGLAGGMLWLIALGAAYVPIRRATGIDPMVALRYE